MAQNGVPLVTLWCMGGQMQPQGHLQVVCNLVDFEVDMQSVLEAPRFRVGEGLTISVEDNVPMNVQAELARKTHQLAPPNTFFGSGQAIFVHLEYGTLIAASDPRRDGCAVGY